MRFCDSLPVRHRNCETINIQYYKTECISIRIEDLFALIFLYISKCQNFSLPLYLSKSYRFLQSFNNCSQVCKHSLFLFSWKSLSLWSSFLLGFFMSSVLHWLQKYTFCCYYFTGNILFDRDEVFKISLFYKLLINLTKSIVMLQNIF